MKFQLLLLVFKNSKIKISNSNLFKTGNQITIEAKRGKKSKDMQKCKTMKASETDIEWNEVLNWEVNFFKPKKENETELEPKKEICFEVKETSKGKSIGKAYLHLNNFTGSYYFLFYLNRFNLLSF